MNKAKEERNKDEKKRMIHGTSPAYVTFLMCMWLKNSFPVVLNITRRREKSRYREESSSIYISRYSGCATRCTVGAPVMHNAKSRMYIRIVGHLSGVRGLQNGWGEEREREKTKALHAASRYPKNARRILGFVRNGVQTAWGCEEADHTSYIYTHIHTHADVLREARWTLKSL